MSEERPSYSVNPIGYVQTSEPEGRYQVKVLPEYAAALEELERFSHVIIVWWADRHDNPADRKALTANLPYAAGKRAGVFACRSEYRPNPIGLTVMPVLHIDLAQGLVILPWIDAFDGSPVLDLKPYLPVSDRVRDVKVAEWMREWPVWMEDSGTYFAEHPVDFGG